MSAYERFENKKQEAFSNVLIVVGIVLIALLGLAINNTLLNN